VLLVGGDFAADLASGALAAGMPASSIVPFASNEAATAWLRANGRAGDLVLLKGSRRYKLEDVLAGLRGAHA
jgi:UDP-N-acetylmuramyl pentapeptide synthase